MLGTKLFKLMKYQAGIMTAHENSPEPAVAFQSPIPHSIGSSSLSVVLFFGTAYRCGASESRGSVLGFDHGK